MGFNKRYITKDMILSCVKEGRDVKKLLRADALIMDSWSSRFFDNYYNSANCKETKTELESQVKLTSKLNSNLNHK